MPPKRKGKKNAKNPEHKPKLQKLKYGFAIIQDKMKLDESENPPTTPPVDENNDLLERPSTEESQLEIMPPTTAEFNDVDMEPSSMPDSFAVDPDSNFTPPSTAEINAKDPIAFNNANQPSQFHSYSETTMKYELSFHPGISNLDHLEKKFLADFKSDTLNFSTLKKICELYVPLPHIEKTLSMNLTNEEKKKLMKILAIELARSISLIFQKPLRHKNGNDDEVHIECINNECSFKVTYKYDYEINRLVLQDNGDVSCQCATSFDNIEFLKYLCYEVSTSYLDLIAFTNKRSVEFVNSITKASFGSYDLDQVNDSTFFQLKKHFDNKISYKKKKIIPPPVIVSLLDIFKDDIDSLKKYLTDLVVNTNSDVYFQTDSQGVVYGIMIFYTNSISNFKSFNGFTAGFEKLPKLSSDKYQLTVFNGWLSNKKSQALSLYISKKDENLVPFMKASFLKVDKPTVILTKEIIEKGNLPKYSLKKIIHLTNHNLKMIKCYEELGLQQNLPSPSLLVVLAKLFNSDTLDAVEVKQLLPFKFNANNSSFIESFLTYNVLTSHHDFKKLKNEFKGEQDESQNENTLKSDEMSSPFKSLYDHPSLVTDVATKYKGEASLAAITADDVWEYIDEFMTTRDLSKYINTLCVLLHLCKNVNFPNNALNVFIQYVISDGFALSSSWMMVNLIGQINANRYGTLNSKFAKKLKVSNRVLQISIKDDLGKSFYKRSQSFAYFVIKDKDYQQNDLLAIMKAFGKVTLKRSEIYGLKTSAKPLDKLLPSFKGNWNKLINDKVKLSAASFRTIFNLVEKVNTSLNSGRTIFDELEMELRDQTKHLSFSGFDFSHFSSRLSAEDRSKFEVVKDIFTEKFQTLCSSIDPNDDDASRTSIKEFTSDIFKSFIASSSKEDCCFNTCFDCIHSFMERIKIVHFFRFIVEVEKPYSQEDLPKSFTYTLRDLDMEEVNHMIELAVDAINGLSLKPKDVLKVSLEEPAVLSRGSETEPEFLKEGVAEDDLTTKIASIIDETIIDYELITSLEEITHDTLEPSKLKIEEIKSNEKTSINQKCRELINANSTDQLAIALNTVNLAKGKTNNEKWLNDTVFKVFFECVDIDKEQVVFLDGVTFAYMRKESLNERSSVNLEKYKDAQTIFCSFNRDDYHWLTAILHKPSKSVVLVDSMADAPKEVLIKDGRVFLNKIWSFANIDESDLSQYKLHLLTSPNQNNTYDCGVFTIMNIYQLMNKYELHLDQTDANNFRYFICKTIFEKKGIEY